MRSVPIPGGVADPGKMRGFVSTGAGTVDALDLRSGKRLWHTNAVSRPLLATSDRLVGIVSNEDSPSEIRVAVLDAETGERRMVSDSLAHFQVPTSTTSQAGAWRLEAKLEAEVLWMAWDFRGRYTGGAPPPKEVVQQAEKPVKGGARIDLKSGRVTSASDAAAALLDWKPPGRIAQQVAEMEPAPFWMGRISEQRFAALTLRELDDKDVLVLTTWDLTAAQIGRSVELVRGQALTPVVTADGKHLLVQSAETEPRPAAKGREASWLLYSLESGETIANSVVVDPSAQEQTVVDSLLLYVIEQASSQVPPGARLLKGVDLKTGRQVWSYPISGPIHLRPRP